MYRLLKLTKSSVFHSQILNVSYTNHTLKLSCCFCKHPIVTKASKSFDCVESLHSTRLQSTSARTAIQNSVKRKKARRSKRKYTELVEVTLTSSSEKKASVSKLNAKHLSLLVEEPDINLGQLHTLKKKSVLCRKNGSPSELRRDFSDEVDKEVVSDVNKFIMEDGKEEAELLREAYLLDLPLSDPLLRGSILEQVDHPEIDDDPLPIDLESVTALKPDVPHSKSKSKKKPTKQTTTIPLKPNQKDAMAKVKQTELDQSGREESLSRSLRSYLELCVTCGFLNRGLATLHFYRNRGIYRNPSKALSIDLYNILLQGFALKGNMSKVQELLLLIQEDSLQMTPQSYAAVFECIGRLPNNPHATNLLHKYKHKMDVQGICFDDLFEKSVFVLDQREKLLTAVEILEPGYTVKTEPVDTCYSCSLLQELNTTHHKAGVYVSPGQRVMSNTELAAFAQEQLESEMKSYVHVKTIEKRSEPTDTILYYRSRLEEAQAEWRETILKAFQRDLNALRAQHHSFRVFRHLNLYPYLRALEPAQFVDIVMVEVRKLAEGSETFSPTVGQLYRELGGKVLARYQLRHKSQTGVLPKLKRLYTEYCDWYLNPSPDQNVSTRHKWQALIRGNSEGPSVLYEEKTWPSIVLTGLGKFLYNIIMRDIKVDVNLTRPNSKTQHLLPAFYTLFRAQGRRLKEELKPHPVLARLFRGAALPELLFETTAVPMVCPPLPWSTVNHGGYLVARTDLVRLPHQAIQQLRRLKDTPMQQLYPALDPLNQLGAVPWTVNEPVLDVILEVFNSGGSEELDVPQPPSTLANPGPLKADATKLERFQMFRERMTIRRRRAEMYSLWCDALYRLSLANHFRGRIFWLPHNLDFRGRVYPVPPHLNHLGSDLARSILIFAKGQPLGPQGLDWLKIHAVNLTGLKKRNSMSERLKFAEEIMPEILDSAKEPLTGRRWWAQSEEPWQTLACCMEIARAIDSGDPPNYVCHFPVHQDGSCNGLQHYAALGRDRAGAESVNLTPSEQPQDVYSRVASLVERERAKDAKHGVKIAQVLEGFIHRKVIKQTVMTTVYGVTRFGARLQIARQLKDLNDFPTEYVWHGSTYLVGKTFESLREMFTSTKEIQDWFTECARLISQVCGENVEWVTPLGLPVVQPYHRHTKRPEVTSNPRILQEHHVLDMYERPNVMKQKNAFPPNFIHSLDSSHMMLTSLFCEREGITFVSVHDCFWTHPNTVDIMNRVCREQFVALHSQPILENLSEFLTQRYSYSASEFANDGSVIDMTKRRLNETLTQLPSTGDFDLSSVLASLYFFS